MLKIQTCADSKLIARLGGLFCDEKQVIGFGLLKKGTLIDPSTFDKEALDGIISNDNFIGMVSFDSVENNDQEADYSTSSTKVRIKTVEGVKGFRFVMSKGSCYQNELAKLDGSRNYEFIPIFINGTALFAKTKSGMLKGFDANIFVGLKMLQIGADVAGSTLDIDLLPSGMAYWQSSSVTVESEEFSFNEINPVEGIKVELPVLLAESTSTTVKLVNSCSGAPITGLTSVSSWKMVRNGVEEPITAIAEVAGTGEYKFTHASIANGQTIDFVISVVGNSVYSLDTNYYAISQSNPKVVA